MATCNQTTSGGIATGEMANLAAVMMQGLLQGLMPAMQAYYTDLFQEREAHKQTLLMFQSVVEGEIALDAIVVNADGWQMKAERPKPMEHSPFMCDTCLEEIPNGVKYMSTMPGVYYHMRCSPITPAETSIQINPVIEMIRWQHDETGQLTELPLGQEPGPRWFAVSTETLNANGVEAHVDGTFNALKNLEAAN